MTVLHGKGASGGIAIGVVKMHRNDKACVKRAHIENVGAEIERFRSAKDHSLAELKELYEKALKEVGEANARIFEIHAMMTDDEDYTEAIENLILSQNVNAEYAVAVTSDNFAEMFSSMDDDYMKERAADVCDISSRLIKNLSGSVAKVTLFPENAIIFAKDLTPSETVQLDKDKIIGFCTQQGSKNSHTSILARTMGVPAVCATETELPPEFDGAEAIIDGSSGTVYINPTPDIREKMIIRQNEEIRKKELLQNLKGKENVTQDGQRINLFANIGGLSDLGEVLANDAGGIGLFRSEFLYLESDDYPGEEAQFQCYKKVLECMAGKKVIVRTLDIGADKKIDYFHLDNEENPALGYRAIRICLTRTDIFKTQLRALYRASVYGNLGIMFPMIISEEEISEIKEIILQVKSELACAGIPFNPDTETGIMTETPASVMISDILAKEVDFFSIGTNDLTQYTLAADRQNPKLDAFCDPHHKAILRMIKIAVDNAHKNGAWVGICGELAADTSLTELFLAMGVDELSVSPNEILPLREKIRHTSLKDRREIINKFL